MNAHLHDQHWMELALKLAAGGQGHVEPNPMVGCIITRDGTLVGSGFHERFGGPHAEINALQMAGEAAVGSTVYLTLEPCSYFGKTPPCVDALIAAKVGRVVIGALDPNPQVNGSGVARLQAAGIETLVGVCEEEATDLIKPFATLFTKHRPWVIAKWAMSLDGKIATVSGESQWISSSESREHFHQTRGRVDAIIVGAGTARADNPMLTARPAGPRTALRVVVDSKGTLSPDSQLAKTAHKTPTLVVAGPAADEAWQISMTNCGVEVIRSQSGEYARMLQELLDELGKRRFTNAVVEGGSRLLGVFLQENLIDEVNLYLAPRIIGGKTALSPVGDPGFSQLADALQLTMIESRRLGPDLFVTARR
jgi:diaminohydroxyphosphoribosylaminopyrimidine deaminase / 5-amino-6-(5-phosphoribosylamino)uracil reductase